MIPKIIEKFLSIIDEDSINIIQSIYQFYNEISENEKHILIAEINKITPVIFSEKVPKEVLAILFPIGKNYAELKSKNISDSELKKCFSGFFKNIKETEFYQFIS